MTALSMYLLHTAAGVAATTGTFAAAAADAAVAAAAAAAASVHVQCNAGPTQIGGRDCIDKIMKANSSSDCRALCCADSAAHPVPFPGAQSAGCRAWYQNQYNQCFMCAGTRHGGFTPPVDPNKCKPNPKRPPCETGLVEPTPGPKPPAPPANGVIPHIGAEVSGHYADVVAGMSMRAPSYANGSSAALDPSTELTTEGWCKMDCQWVVFDARPAHAWAPPMDDPEKRQQDYSGEWTLEISGNATVSLVESKGITLGKPKYDEARNRMTQPITFAKGGYPEVQNLLVLRFTNTRANPTSPTRINGSGFTNMSLWRPGYGPTFGKSQLFTDEFKSLISIFSRTRWMRATGTCDYDWRCGPPNAAACSVIGWEERSRPGLAFYPVGDHTLPPQATPFEHLVLAANELNSDLWINVPLTASSPNICRVSPSATASNNHTKCIKEDETQTFEYQLALLMRDGNHATGGVGLKKGLKLYVEHSNEGKHAVLV